MQVYCRRCKYSISLPAALKEPLVLPGVCLPYVSVLSTEMHVRIKSHIRNNVVPVLVIWATVLAVSEVAHEQDQEELMATWWMFVQAAGQG